MQRVTGIGGIFFKSQDPQRAREWYERHLGIKSEHGFSMFRWRKHDDPQAEGTTVWSVFPADTKYFAPGPASFMINYRVDDLDAVLAALKAEGVKIDEKGDDSEYGKFAWVYDPDGNKVELWQPPAK